MSASLALETDGLVKRCGGEAVARLARLSELPWIERVVTERQGAELSARIHVRDERKAETELLMAPFVMHLLLAPA